MLRWSDLANNQPYRSDAFTFMCLLGGVFRAGHAVRSQKSTPRRLDRDWHVQQPFANRVQVAMQWVISKGASPLCDVRTYSPLVL